jgi:hypothetical protein
MNDPTILIALLAALGAAVVLLTRLQTLPTLRGGLLRPFLPVLYVQVQVILAAVFAELRQRVADTESKWDDELVADLALVIDAAVDETFRKLGYLDR